MNEQPTPQQILNDPRELWLNSPVGYPYADKISKNDEGGLRRFMIMISGSDEDSIEIARAASHVELLKMLLDSKFTFDPEWYGARELPQRPDGSGVSALDDPSYRYRHGIGNSL